MGICDSSLPDSSNWKPTLKTSDSTTKSLTERLSERASERASELRAKGQKKADQMESTEYDDDGEKKERLKTAKNLLSKRLD